MRQGKAHVPFPSGPAGSAATRLTSENVPWPTSSSTSYRSVPGIRSSNMAEGQRGRPCIGSRGEGGGVAVSVGCRDAAFYGGIGSPLWLGVHLKGPACRRRSEGRAAALLDHLRSFSGSDLLPG